MCGVIWLQAACDLEGNVRHVAALMDHPAFDITKPPACENLLLGFADSVPNFHAEDGSGYVFMADAVLKVSLALLCCCWPKQRVAFPGPGCVESASGAA
jgi:hypothetical protein